ALERALALAAARDAVVLGPGLGSDSETRAFCRALYERCPVPLVADADGLNAFAGLALPRRRAATILTPHPGAMARLVASSTRAVLDDRVEVARALAEKSGALVILKGQRTLVAEPGGRVAVNPTGNPGMATGGTGDVLAGILGALVARALDPWTAATAGV